METQFEDIAIELDDIPSHSPPPLPPLPPLPNENNVVTDKLNRFVFKDPIPPR